jgi:hypothetical protein
MITNQICRDKAIHQLSDDLSRLAFTWLITFADCDGRVFGDPAIIKSILFPRREDISTNKMTTYITEWATAGLIVWYGCKGDQWIYFPKFEKNQPGLRKEREPSSDIPIYSAATCRIIAGCLPEECPVNGMEWNGMEEKGMEAAPDPFDCMKAMVEKMTGYPSTQRDVVPLTNFVARGVIEDDIREAITFLDGKKQVRGAADLEGSVMTAFGKRIQKGSGRRKEQYTGPNGEVMEL